MNQRSFRRICRVNRSALIASVLVSIALLIPYSWMVTGARQTSTRTDPLASWNDGAAKQAIVKFVQTTTDRSSAQFVPPEARVATFDQDGTLWVSHSQVVYCLDRVPAVVKARPELANVEPSKTVLSGNREAIGKLSVADLEKILMATLTGMNVDKFQAEVKTWLETAKDPRWKRPLMELTYVPMLDLMKYLRANGYKTYIVTGGGQDFVRVYSEKVYGAPPEQVVGTATGTKCARIHKGWRWCPTGDVGPA
jgi:phosphoglycolate phosphatase-like HAD superfamily hydrolase